MKGRYGIAMNIYGKILPGTKQIGRIVALSREAKQRLSWMDWYNSHNKNARLTCRRFGISPDTFYRWKNHFNPADLSTLEDDRATRTPRKLRQPQTDPELVCRIRKLRETYPRWGKKKIWKLLKNEGCYTSVSTVGRTFDRLRARGILNEPAIVTARLTGAKRRRRYKRPYAVPRDWNYKAKYPGDLVQIDTAYVSLPWGKTRYQFTASDYTAKHTVRITASTISSKSARRILDAIKERFPYKIKAAQIDGGSEFKAEFERECQKRNITLFVLPTKSPKLNGVVERMQRTSREEIYDIKPMPLIVEEHNELLKKEDYIYNHIRPHDSLKLLTPNEYYLHALST